MICIRWGDHTKINNENSPLKDFIDYDFEYLSTNLNIQWISLNQLKNIEGQIDFLLKDFKSDASLGDSVFLRALKIFNLNAIIENINNEANITSSNFWDKNFAYCIFFNRLKYNKSWQICPYLMIGILEVNQMCIHY